MPKAAVYIDGFSLYHAIDDLGADHLKWCNYWHLAELLLADNEILASVVVATAHHPDFDKKTRHQLFLATLRNVDVTVLLGHYVREPRDCRGCGRVWQQPTEKEGDINLAAETHPRLVRLPAREALMPLAVTAPPARRSH